MGGLFSRTPVVEAAEAAVDELAATVAKWQTQADTSAAEADELAPRVGELALDDEAAATQAAADIVRLRAQVSVARSAAAAAERRLEAARRTVLSERAVVLRARAARLDKALKLRQRKTAELTAALAAFEHCQYVPYAPPSNGGAVGQPSITYVVPMSQAIATHVTWLGAQAEELDRQARVASADQLVAAVEKVLPGPSILDQAVADDGTFTGDATRFNGVTLLSR